MPNLDPVSFPDLVYPTTVVDSQFTIVGSSDTSKTLKFEVDAQSANSDLTIDTGAQTADWTLTVPVLTASATLAVLSEPQTFSGAKTFSAITTISNATASTAPGNGALVVTGGIGASGKINCADDITAGIGGGNVTIGLASGGATFGRIIVSSGSFVLTSGATNLMGLSSSNCSIAITTTATSSITGSLIVGDGSTAATNVSMGEGKLYVGTNAAVDTDSTAGNTRLMIYDVDNGTLERVSVGAADSGGAGYKVLRIPN